MKWYLHSRLTLIQTLDDDKQSKILFFEELKVKVDKGISFGFVKAFMKMLQRS